MKLSEEIQMILEESQPQKQKLGQLQGESQDEHTEAGRLQKRFARAASGGRKREFSREISQLGKWFWLQGQRDAWSGQSFAEMRCKGKLG